MKIIEIIKNNKQVLGVAKFNCERVLMELLTFEERLTECRLKLGLSQMKLALKCGLTQAAIAQYESETRRPSFDQLWSLADALKITVNYLIGKNETSCSDLAADSRISEMMEGMWTFSEKQKYQLFRVYEFLASRYEKETGATVLE